MRRFICYNSIIAEREAGTLPEGWTPPVGGARLRPFSREKRPGFLRGALFASGFYWMPSFAFRPSCKTWEKLTPAFSASTLSQDGRVTFLRTVRRSLARR